MGFDDKNSVQSIIPHDAKLVMQFLKVDCMVEATHALNSAVSFMATICTVSCLDDLCHSIKSTVDFK